VTQLALDDRSGKPPLVGGWTEKEWDEAWEAAEHDPELMPTLPPLDPARPMEGRHHADGSDTELLAAARVTPRSGTQRQKVLDALHRRSLWGATDFELWRDDKIGARPHVPGTRREELIADGWPIRDSGKRRPTDTGGLAIVWVLEDKA